MPRENNSYKKLEAHLRQIGALNQAAEMLYWDMSTMMPAGGEEARSEQLTALNTLCHGMLTAPEVSDLLDAAEIDKNLDNWQQANLKEIRNRWLKATAVDKKLVEALTQARVRCETSWRNSRANNDFNSILNEFNILIELVRETGQARADVLGLELYDALIDDFETGGRSAEIDVIFDDLVEFLPDLANEIIEYQSHQPKVIMPDEQFPIERQRTLAENLMQQIGFDFDHGRLDISQHPFCGGIPDDIRITTRYNYADFTSSLMGVLHETGHAMYERGLPKKWRYQPVGESMGMTIHESQSLLLEMQVCRSAAFIEFAAPIMKQAFNGVGPAWGPENLLRLFTRVQSGCIRVEADEVTYPLHIILRYRLEKSMIMKTLPLADLPEAWNNGMRELLGITPINDQIGCLQDIHWYDGAWGYFPTYTLGAMTAAQLYDTAKTSVPRLENNIREGNFTPLLFWLRENVHSKGRSIGTSELVTSVTGRPLDTAAFKRHLITRYLG